MSISYIANFDTHQIFSLHIISNISHLEEIELQQLLPLFLPKYPVSSLKRTFVKTTLRAVRAPKVL